jgi:hypothetical protein
VLRAEAKRSSAANRDGSADRGSVFGRRDSATRASSLSADGSGAPSHRGRLAVLALAIAALALLALAPLSQAKILVSGFGTPNYGSGFGASRTAFGGQFPTAFNSAWPTGVVINTSGVGAPAGTTYVVDFGGARVQRFSATGAFQRLWGQDVIATTVDETQLITANASAGTFTLSLGGFPTDPINFNADIGTVAAALAALPAVGGAGNVAVAGQPGSTAFVIFFRGALAGVDLPQITVDTSQLSGTLDVSTLADGDSTTANTGRGFEICTVAVECKWGERTRLQDSIVGSTANGGQLGEPQGIAIDQATGNVYVTDKKGGSGGNSRVSQFDANGNFLRAWGWDVVSSGGAGDIPGTNERQTIIVRAGAGSFTLSFADGDNGANSTAPIAAGASAGDVEAALEALPGIAGAANIDVTGAAGGPWTVEFVGVLADRDVNSLGGTGVTIATPTTGAPGGFEICTVEADCKKAAVGGTEGGRFGDFNMGYLAVDSAGNVWVADNANRRLQEFDSSGNFIAVYGYGVNGGASLESCVSTAVGVCRAGTSGTTDGRFSSGQPSQIAFDNLGNLYAPAANGVTWRFNPAITTATNFATATLPTYTTQVPEAIASSQGGTRLLFAVANNVTGGGERQILEIDPADESVKDVSLAGAGLINTAGGPLIAGLAADAAGRIYATTASNVQSPRPRNVLVLGDTAPSAPSLTVNSVAAKTDTTAVFTATVDPRDGLLDGCKFQYSTDQRNWTDVAEPDCATLNATGVQVLSQSASGLTPNTHYFVRFQASRPLIPGTTVITGVRAFDTDSVAPAVTDVGVDKVADTSARLAATINPKNSATSYVFEYGTTTSLGSSTAPVDIGAGNAPITVNRTIGGLSPDTDYYFKLVATNAFGSTSSDQKTFHTRTDPPPPAQEGNCPNEAIRQAQGSTDLPECRAYEQVSPPEKNQGGVDQSVFGSPLAVSQDGDASHFCTSALFGDPPAQQTHSCAPYISRRTAEGWRTFAMEPYNCKVVPATGEFSIGQTWISPNFDRGILSRGEFESCAVPPLDPDTPYGGPVLYRSSYGGNPFDVDEAFSYDLLTPRAPFQREGGFGDNGPGGDADFSHVFYQATSVQTADAPATRVNKLYGWTEEGSDGCLTPGGCLSLVSIRPDGNPFTTRVQLPLFFNGGGSLETVYTAISEDGERVYFNAGSSDCNNSFTNTTSCQLYLREGGAETLHVSATECTVDCGAVSSAAKLQWASPGGNIALFASCAKLTNASSAPNSCANDEITTSRHFKLYRWDRNAAPGARLIDLSVDHEPGDGSQADHLDLIGSSDDGNTVFFVAGGQIVSGESTRTGTTGNLKLYRWTFNGGNPRVDYLGPYVSRKAARSAINLDNTNSDSNTSRLYVRVTPDGRYLTISTPLALDPAVDRDSHVDLYRWDQAGGWICASCQEPGAPSAGDNQSVQFEMEEYHLFYASSSAWPTHPTSEDGQRIFFTSLDALVPEDTNGETGCPLLDNRGEAIGGAYYACQDVYEWHDGTLSLISGGDQPVPSVFIGAGEDGRTVHFMTSQRLVGWDVDNGTDVYVARTGGGFPEPDPVPPGCEGEACRDAGSAAPNTPGAGSAAFQGPGNQRASEPKPRCPKGKRKVTRNGRTRCVAKRGNRGNKRAAKHNRRAAR